MSRIQRPENTTIALFAGIALFLAGLMVVRFGDGAAYQAVSTAFIIAMALPSYAALVRWLSWRKGLALVALLSLIPAAVEGLAILTGIPYGHFTYSATLGYVIGGIVPWTVLFAYPPILFAAVTIASRTVRSTPARILLAGAVGLAVDLVFDPAAVHAGFWAWEVPGAYYGVPLQNFIGWAVTGTCYAAIFFSAAKKETARDGCVPVMALAGGFWTVCLWTGYLIAHGLYLPVIPGILLMGVMGWTLLRPSCPWEASGATGG
ncbi:MAG TPA: carotenoid biosynthesis protein [Methanoculleus sp.]|nr:carotenoid biosynthesis protein [Methanoculleus sp.]